MLHRRFYVSVTDFASCLGKKPSRVTHTSEIEAPNSEHVDRFSRLRHHVSKGRTEDRQEETCEPKTETFSAFKLNRQVVEALEKNNLRCPTAIQSGLFQEWFKSRNDIIMKAQTGTGKSLGYIALLYNEYFLRKQQQPSENVFRPSNVIMLPSAVLADQLLRWLELLHGSIDPSLCRMVVDNRQGAITQPGPSHILISTGKLLFSLFSANQLRMDSCQTIIVDEVDLILKPLKQYATEKQKLNRQDHPVPAHLFLSQLARPEGNPNSAGRRFIYSSATINEATKKYLKYNKLVRPGAVFVEAGDGQPRGLMESTWECPRSITHKHLLLPASNSGDDLESLSYLIHDIVAAEGSKQGLIVVPDTFNKTKLVASLQSFNLDPKLLFVNPQSVLAHPLLVGTAPDVRGLDIHTLGYVVIVGLPESVAHYLHAAGRVGRMGRPGTAYTILACERDLLRHLGILTMKLHVNSLPHNRTADAQTAENNE